MTAPEGPRDRIMAVMVSSSRFAMTVTDRGRLSYWQSWRALANDPLRARSAFRTSIARFDPDLIVMEDPKQLNGRKGATLELLQVLVQCAEDEPVRLIKLQRLSRYDNRCAQLAAIVKRFPEVEKWCPEKIPVYMTEPRHLIYFDALDLTLRVMDAPAAGDDGGQNLSGSQGK